MYSNNLVVAVKANGKVLREKEGKIFIPVGTEYTILVKNLNSTRVRVKIHIDGQDVLDGSALIIQPNSETSVERSVRNGNLQTGNKLKFIQKTAATEARRGLRSDDGLIRVEYEFERKQAPQTYPNTYITSTYKGQGPYYFANYQTTSDTILGGMNSPKPRRVSGAMGSSLGGSTYPDSALFQAQSAVPYSTMDWCDAADVQAVGASSPVAQNVAGFTVAGSMSTQKFTYTSDIIGDGVKFVMVLEMVGEVAGTPVSQPVTVTKVTHCTTCGTVIRPPYANFCAACGTAVKLY